MSHALTARYRRNIKATEEGFTLIELLMAILIIGVIVAIAFPIYSKQIIAARTAAMTSDVRNTVTEIQTWLAVKKPVLAGNQVIDVVKLSSDSPVRNGGTTNVYTTGTTGPTGINFVMSKETNLMAAIVTLENRTSGSSAGPYYINVSAQIWSPSELVGLEVDSRGTRPYYS